MLEYNKIGLIKSGPMEGFFLKAVYDKKDTGGYYALYSKNFSDKYAEGYDDWFLTKDEIENNFKDISIEWSE